MALTTGFMCIVACDCNERPSMSGRALRHFGSSPVEAKKARDSLCQVRSLAQFYSVDFSKSRISGNKCVFNKRTIKVCVSCF